MSRQLLRRCAPFRHHVLAAVAASALAVAALASSGIALASAARPQPSVQTVVVVLTPFLTWDDVTSGQGYALEALAGAGAIGNMNSITADLGWPNAEGGALTLGAGRWAAAPVAGSAATGGLPAITAANADSLNPPEIGALGSVVHAAGLKTAAVGSAREGAKTPPGFLEPATLAAMDAGGRVDVNLAGASLLATDPGAPFGVRADRSRLIDAVRSALGTHQALIVVDPGDLERAHDAQSTDPGRYARYHEDAVASLSEVAAGISAATAGRSAMLMLVSAATDKPYYQPPYFGPTIVVGPGFEGALASASTRRAGLVTNLDFAPTVLSALGLEATSTMIGLPMGSIGSTPSTPREVDARIAALSRLGTSVGAVDYVRDLFFIRWLAHISEAVLALVCALALVPALSRARPLGRVLVLFALAIPGGAWLLFAVTRYPLDGRGVFVAFGVATVGVFALVLGLSRALRRRPEVPLLALCTLTSLLICADQWSGHPLESGLFSYSIRSGWRYYGMGNEGAALLVGASILAVALVCDLAENTTHARMLRVWLMPVVGVVALVTSAASFAGANAGVAVWGVVAYGVAWARLNRVPFTWRTVATIALVIAVLVAAFAAIDMLAGKAETHVGHFFAELAGGDFASVNALIVRKAENNIGYLPQTPYTLLCLALLGSIAALWWLGERPLAAVLKGRRGVSAALVGLLVGGLAATLTEDSGVVMPALMLYAGVMPLFFLALGAEPLAGLLAAPEAADTR